MGRETPILVATENLILGWISPDVEDQMEATVGFGGIGLNTTVYSQYGGLRRTKIRKIFSDIWLEDEEIEEALGKLANMFGKNQLRCLYPSCACGKMEGFLIWKRRCEA